MRYGLALLAVIVLYGVSSCGFEAVPSKEASSTGLRSSVWSSPTAVNPVDGSNARIMAPEVAIETDPVGDDGESSAMAVWLEQVDENPFDLLPAVTHVYARYFVGGSWEGSDASCPGDSRLENNDADGICQVDTLTDSYHSTAPRIAMNGSGDAIVVWQQSDGTDCFSAVSGTQPCTRVYARSFSSTAGVWSTLVTQVSLTGDRPAAHPDIAMEPDSDGTAIVVFDQWNGSIWEINANRCVVATGTVCGDDAGEWGAPGTTSISTGSLSAGSPRIGMDANGDATVAWIQFANGTCIDPETTNTFTCTTSKVYVNRSDIGAAPWDWLGPTNITPGQLTSCGGASSVCRDFGQLRVARGSTTSFVVFKVYEYGSLAEGRFTHCSFCGQGNNESHHHTDIVINDTATLQAAGIYGSRVLQGSFANTELDTYEINNGDGTIGSLNCADVNLTTPDTGEEIMNCNLDAPDIAVEPDSGLTAMAVYERYDGTNSFIRAKRYDQIPTIGWKASARISVGSNDAYAPRIAMDNSGNSVAVWTQSDGATWRIYSRQNTGGTWATSDAGCPGLGFDGADDGVCNVDGNVGPEMAYYNPVVAMDQLGSAMSLFIGWTSIGSYTSTRLLAVTGP